MLLMKILREALYIWYVAKDERYASSLKLFFLYLLYASMEKKIFFPVQYLLNILGLRKFLRFTEKLT